MSQNCETPIQPTDAEHLARFIAGQDEAAFRSLVEKHSGLVWSICCRQLRFLEDREDAFQNTFVVLARKARTIRKGQSIASWLYKVAYRSAISVAQARSRHAKQTIVEEPEVVDNTFATLRDREQAMILDEEVNRLPEKLRSVVVLCCIEGKSRIEAAEELNCTEASVKSRLARGRQELQMRLARRGISLATLLAAVVAFSEDAAARVPSHLIEAAVTTGAAIPPESVLSNLTDSICSSLRSAIGSTISSPIGWAVMMAILGSTLMVRWSVTGQDPVVTTDIAMETTTSLEEQIQLVLATLEQDAATAPSDPRLAYLRAKLFAYESLAKAQRLEIAAYQATDEVEQAKRNQEARDIKQTADERLRKATVDVAHFATMKGLWGEEEATKIIADMQIQATDPESNHAAVIARMAEQARRFELPNDPDPVLPQIEEAPLASGKQGKATTPVSVEVKETKQAGGER